MSFKLDGVQRDLVTSYAIHQDSDSIIAFIEDLVTTQAGKPLPADNSLVLTPSEQKIIEGLRGQ
jgi:hypothetical protein